MMNCCAEEEHIHASTRCNSRKQTRLPTRSTMTINQMWGWPSACGGLTGRPYLENFDVPPARSKGDAEGTLADRLAGNGIWSRHRRAACEAATGRRPAPHVCEIQRQAGHFRHPAETNR